MDARYAQCGLFSERGCALVRCILDQIMKIVVSPPGYGCDCSRSSSPVWIIWQFPGHDHLHDEGYAFLLEKQMLRCCLATQLRSSHDQYMHVGIRLMLFSMRHLGDLDVICCSSTE